jgi:hypothetical protein
VIGFNTSGISTDDARQQSLISGLLQRFDKRLQSSGQAGHQARLSGVYRDAIELNGGSLVAAGGYVSTIGLLGALVTIRFFGHGVYRNLIDGAYVFFVLNVLTIWSLFLVGVYFEMFSPSEQPIYFDRARRKVCYVHQGRRKRFILFGPSTVEARMADWSLVDCELHAKLGGSTTSVRRTYHLLFLVRASETDPTIVDWFVLPQVEFPGAMWEYIRGYMEADMPPLIANEAPPIKGKGFDMIEALRQRYKDYWRDWKEFPWTQLWQHLVLPLFAVFLIVNRFVVWTAQTVSWPRGITEALGAPMTPADVEADTTNELRARPKSSES